MRKEINILLDKYFKGISTLEEEKALKDYFASVEVDPSHEKYRPLFGSFEKERSIKFDRKKKEIPASKKNNFFVKMISIIVSSAAVGTLFVFLPSQYETMETYAYINGEKITEIQFIEEYTLAKLEKTYNILNDKLSPLENLEKIKSGLSTGANSVQDVKEAMQYINETTRKN